MAARGHHPTRSEMTHTTDPTAAATEHGRRDETDTCAVARERSIVLDDLIDTHAASSPDRFRMLTGDRPTGPLHVGHYLASLRNRVRLQDKGVETFIVIADYQVVTDRDSVGDIGRNVQGLVLDYLAAGIDPLRTTIFTHSAVPALNQLMLPFLSPRDRGRAAAATRRSRTSSHSPTAGPCPGCCSLTPCTRRPTSSSATRGPRAGRPRPAPTPRADPLDRSPVQQPVCRRPARLPRARARC